MRTQTQQERTDTQALVADALGLLDEAHEVTQAVDRWCFEKSSTNEEYRELLHRVSGQLRARAYENVRASGQGP